MRTFGADGARRMPPHTSPPLTRPLRSTPANCRACPSRSNARRHCEGTSAYCQLGAVSKTLGDKGTSPMQRLVMALGVAAALGVIKVISDLSTTALKGAGIDDDDEQKDKATS